LVTNTAGVNQIKSDKVMFRALIKDILLILGVIIIARTCFEFV